MSTTLLRKIRRLIVPDEYVGRIFRSTVGNNILSLYGLQFANYLLPLVTIPYLVRVLGVEKYGLVAFGQGLIGYFALVIDYGFNYSATRKISVRRDNMREVCGIASAVWAAKVLIFFLGLAVLFALSAAIPAIGDNRILVFVLYGMTLGNVLFPLWLFQGLEKMISIAVVNFIAKLVVTVCIFVFVRAPSDVLVYASLLAIQWTLAGALAMGYSFVAFKLHLVPPRILDVKDAFVDGWTLFLSTGAVSLYTTGNSFILGLLTNNAAVGYYSAAEKLVRAFRGLMGPVSQAVFPRFSRLANESKQQALLWGRRLLFSMAGIGFVLSSVLLLGAGPIVTFILGKSFGPAIAVTRILSFLPFFIGVSNVLGVQLMIPFGRDKAFTSILFGAGLVNLIMAILLAPLLLQDGMALSVVFTESMVAMSMMLYLHRNKMNPLSHNLIGERRMTDQVAS